MINTFNLPRLYAVLTILVALFFAALSPAWGQEKSKKLVTPEEFLSLLLDEPVLLDKARAHRNALRKIGQTWRPGYAVMLVEILNFVNDREVARSILSALESNTRQRFGFDLHAWYEWIWGQAPQEHPDYPQFKSLLYRSIDPRFGGYFASDRTTKIRLDEVRWGGVRQDGIPPLRSPKMIPAGQADYLEDDNIVFGIEVEGDARAYPKRILAWHELFTDEVGGLPVAGVYCTLCGTVLLYETELDGVHFDLGTSGFLYRSNKLMYDQATQSLWSTLRGKPVIGPLVRTKGSEIQLRRRSVVTTTWKEWKRRHPKTTVLSLDTGHRRNYDEGVAYQEYFATDRLMYNVPKLDRRLKNKDEVLTLLLDQHRKEPLAIAAKFLRKRTVYHDRIGETSFVVLTDATGANRVYATEGLRFESWDQDAEATDEKGVTWRLSESQLLSSEGKVLPRLPAQRAFWFGWFAAFPETRLVLDLGDR